MRRIFEVVVVIVALAVTSLAWAIEPFVVTDIRVEGLQRVEAGTVFATMPLRIGDRFDETRSAPIIRALFALGLFKDVRLEAHEGVLIVQVQERPTIANINFVGLKEFDKEILLKALKEAGLSEGRPFDRSLADKAEQELKRTYINKSLYGTEVSTVVAPVERNRVNLTFNIVESQVARIASIRIQGAQAIAESTLRDQMDLDTTSLMSWYTKSDRYSRAKLNADLETIRSYYLHRGYIDFRIVSTQVALSANKEQVDISITLAEGQRYVVSAVSVQGDFLGKEETFKSLIKIEVGRAYNSETVAQTVKAFSDLYGKFGFAFARVDPQTDIDRANAQVKLTLRGEPGRRAFVRRINIEGNTQTRDAVIRRELRQLEASWYDGDRIRLSRDRVDRLGHFEEVEVRTQEVAGAADLVDLVFAVKEKRSGSVTLGAGFSSAERLSLQFTYSENNAWGSGQSVSASLNTSKYNKTYEISTTNPYFTDSGVSGTWSLFRRQSRPYYMQVNGDYQTTTTGGGLGLGLPVSEFDKVFVGINAEQLEIESGASIPAAYLTYATEVGYRSRSYPLSLGWSRDDRDSFLNPSRGQYVRLHTNVSYWGDVKYASGTGQYQIYVPLNKQYTLGFNTELGVGRGMHGQTFPVFKNFYSGGLGSVRGFQQHSLGPRDVTGAWLGGAKKVTFNTEITSPFPGAGNDRSLRLVGFYDVGNVYGERERVDFSALRAAYGVGLSWVSAVGPLRFTYAWPMRAFAGDTIQKFQFQIGTAF